MRRNVEYRMRLGLMWEMESMQCFEIGESTPGYQQMEK